MRKVLKASAGTGKTYRLSLEYVARLLQGADFEKIGVMTFTRKATAEIRERILAHLAEIIENPEASEVAANLRAIYPELEIERKELETTYRTMRQNKEQINVSTIDSFLNTIFQQAVAPYLNVYDYQIISGDENQELVEAVFKRILDNPAYFQQLEEFLTANVKRDVDDYIDLLQKIVNNRWKFMLLESKPAEERVAGDIAAQFERCVEILQNIARKKGNDWGADHFRKDFRACFALKGEKLTDWLVDNYKLCIKKHFWNGNKTRGKSVQQLKAAMAEEYEQFRRQLAAKIYNQELLPYQQQILDFSQQVFALYDQLKFKEKKFTHADISNYTYRYLYEPELDLLADGEASSYFFELLGTEIKTLLIDEFQDTSVLQWKVLQPLINNSDQVIAVGDKKQSIYSWRGGEPELFANLEAILDGTSETLATSYRSQQVIIDFVNRFFSNLTEEWDYSAVDHLEDKTEGYVEVLVGGQNGTIRTDTKKFARKSEEKQQQIEEFNRQLTTDLPAEIAATVQEKVENYGAVGILARRNDDLKRIAQELEKQGVPYILESQDSLVEHPAVEPIYYLSRYLAFGDYFDLVKFLRSPVVGIDSQSLKEVVNNRDLIEDYLQGEAVKLPDQKWGAALDFIRELKELKFTVLAQQMIEKLGLVEKYADNPNALKNIYQFFQLMNEYDYLVDFMTYVEEKKASEELKQVGLSEVEAVKLLTIHQSKGLSFETEFFYWNISRGGNWNRGLEFYLELDDQFAEVTDYLLTDAKYNKLLDYLGLDFYAQQQQREFIEEINNVYVAMTRPERNLFLYVDVPKQFADGEWATREWSGKDYELYEEAILRGAQADYLKNLTNKKTLGQFKESEPESDSPPAEIGGLADYFAGSFSSGGVKQQKEIEFDLTQEKKRVAGLAIHYYLEQIKYDTAQERQLARQLVRAKYGSLLGASGLQDIFARVEEFLAANSSYFSDRWAVFTERQIEGEDETYRVDRLLVDKDEQQIIIIDYKTGADREWNQLTTYKSVIAAQVADDYQIEAEFLQV